MADEHNLSLASTPVAAPAALQVIILGCGGGPVESNTTAFLVRSMATGWAKGSVVAVDAGVHMGAIAGILAGDQPPGLGSALGPALPYQLASGPFAGLELPHGAPGANAAHITRTLVDTYLITHPHLDHISGFVINTAGLPGVRPKRLAALPSTIAAFKAHIFNNVIWPNLSDENDGAGLITYMRLVEGGSPALGNGDDRGYLEICDGLSVKAWSVSHGHCMESHSHRGSSSGRPSICYSVSGDAVVPAAVAAASSFSRGLRPYSLPLPHLNDGRHHHQHQHHLRHPNDYPPHHHQRYSRIHSQPQPFGLNLVDAAPSSAAGPDDSFPPASRESRHSQSGIGAISNGHGNDHRNSNGGSGSANHVANVVHHSAPMFDSTMPSFPSPSLSRPERMCVYNSSAYFIRDVATGREVLIYGDVEPDSVSLSPRNLLVWAEAAPKVAAGSLTALLIECSYDNSQPVDRLYGHLTPAFLMQELRALAAEVDLARRVAAAGPAGRKRKRFGIADEAVSPRTLRPLSVAAPGDGPDDGFSLGTSATRHPRDAQPSGTYLMPDRQRPGLNGVHPLPVDRNGDIGHELALGQQHQREEPGNHEPESEPGRERQHQHELELPLRGLRVVVIHVKDKLSDGLDAGDTILRQLLEEEREARLGCQFIISHVGQSIFV